MSGSGRISDRLRRVVSRRAKGRCEYCQIPIRYDVFGSVIDHVIARQHGGQTAAENLALSCSHCNAHKGPNIAGIDRNTMRLTSLFNPRTDIWSEHFQWSGTKLVGTTSKGRCTVAVLAINDPFKLAARESLMQEGVY